MGTVVLPQNMGSLVPLTTSIPSLSVVNSSTTAPPVFGWAFTPASNQVLCTERLYAANYGASNPNVSATFDFYSSITTGNVTWEASLSVLTPGDAQSVLTDAFATAATQATAINSTANGLTRGIVVVTSLDSLTANDSFELKLRCTSATTLTGGVVVLVGLTITYSDT